MKTQSVEWEHEMESNFRVCSVKSLQGDSICEWGAARYFPIKHGGIMGNVHLNSWRGNDEEGWCFKSLFPPLTIRKRSKLFCTNRGVIIILLLRIFITVFFIFFQSVTVLILLVY